MEPISFNVLSAFIGSVTVQITCVTAGATIYYTTDGEEPTSASTAYTEPFEITQNTTIKAIAVKEGLLDSEVASVSFTVALPTPVLEKQAGTASDNCTVDVTNIADYASYTGYKLVYTTDGSEPLETGTTTTGEIAVTANGTIKVKAFCTGYGASETASITVDDLKVQTPVISEVSAPTQETLTTTLTADEPIKVFNTTQVQISSATDADNYDYYVTADFADDTADIDNVKLTDISELIESQFKGYADSSTLETAKILLSVGNDYNAEHTEFMSNTMAVSYGMGVTSAMVPINVTIKIVSKN